MNPFNLSASDMMIWGLVLHLIADWPLQNDWMANNKMKRHYRPSGYTGVMISHWWARHPAAYVHSLIHMVLLSLVFGWVAIPIGYLHLIIDCRWPVQWWSEKVKQTQAKRQKASAWTGYANTHARRGIEIYDVGTEVRIWTDQVFHIICIALAALVMHI